MAESRGEAGAVDALDRFWEALLGRGPGAADGIAANEAKAAGSPSGGAEPDAFEEALAATVRRVHALPDAPGPGAGFVARLEEELMASHPGSVPTTGATTVPTALPATGRLTVSAEGDGGGNGLAPGGWWVTAPTPAPRRARRRAWWRALEGLAAAALVLLIAAGTAIGWGGLPGRGGAPPSVPAVAQAAPGAAVVPGAAMQRGNAGRTGEVAGPGPLAEPGLAWRAAIGGETGLIGGQPMVVDGVAYVSEQGADGRLVLALDAASGAERWKAEIVRPQPGAGSPYVNVTEPTVAAGMVFVGTSVEVPVVRAPGEAGVPVDPETGRASSVVVESRSEGSVVALDAASGAKRWQVETGEIGWASPTVADGVVYVPSDGAVLALDAATGVQRWRSGAPAVSLPPDEEPWSGPVAVGDGLVFATSSGRVLRAIDAGSGAERWRVAAEGDGWVGEPVVADGAVFVWAEPEAAAWNEEGVPYEASPSMLRAFDAVTGAERWSYEGVGQDPTVGAGLVFLNADTRDGTGIVALDATTGQERWSTTVEGYSGDTPVLAGGVLFFGTFQDGVNELGPIADFLGIGARNYLYALDAATGQQLWRVETEALSSAPAVADGTVFLVSGGGEGGAGTLRAYREG